MSKLIGLLCAYSGLSENDVRNIISTAPSRYKSYRIQKRNGGTREIAQPSREVKYLQRILLKEFLAFLPIDDAATAYRERRSIYHNALPHASGGAIMKFDFRNFFPSITAADWMKYCQSRNLFDDADDIAVSSSLLFRRTRYGSILRLSIGAPTSPILSNILMAEFDRKIKDSVAKDKVIYTRYADDITFSAQRTGNLSRVELILRRLLKEMKSPTLKINEDKFVVATKKYRRVVTGLVLTDAGGVSLGRDKKRAISARVHHSKIGLLNVEETLKLAGDLAYANAVEPAFIDRLRSKYGNDEIERIRRGHQSTS